MPTAVSNEMQENVAMFVGYFNEEADGPEIEQTPLSTWVICEDGEEGYIVLTLGPLKVLGERTFAVIEGRRHFYCHLMDAMSGQPKGPAVRVSDEWDWRLTVEQIQHMDEPEE